MFFSAMRYFSQYFFSKRNTDPGLRALEVATQELGQGDEAMCVGKTWEAPPASPYALTMYQTQDGSSSEKDGPGSHSCRVGQPRVLRAAWVTAIITLFAEPFLGA